MTSSFTTAPATMRMALGLLALSSSAALAQGLPDRLELHGSLNAAYGRSSELPVVGVPLTGTSDYRVFTLQGRYTLTENDQVVAQVFNRRVGTSPLAPALPDVTMQWAYWQHKAGDFTVKVGRNPLPRGLSNETRYIGTVHPFFRPAQEVQQEGFDAIDGTVITYRHELGAGLELEQHGFAGGSENRVVSTTSAGQEVRIQRTENMFGGQTFLHLPVMNSRIGVYGARYNIVTATSSGYRTNLFYSAEVNPLDRVKLEGEYSRTSGFGPSNDTRAAYGQGTFRITDRLSLGYQHAILDRMLFFTNSDMNFVLPDVNSNGASAIVRLTSNSVLKVEHHWRTGWTYDTATPPIAAQTATDVTLNPRLDARYFLISVAASF